MTTVTALEFISKDARTILDLIHSDDPDILVAYPSNKARANGFSRDTIGRVRGVTINKHLVLHPDLSPEDEEYLLNVYRKATQTNRIMGRILQVFKVR